VILSDAIILDVEDAKNMCDVVQSVLYGRKKNEQLSPEQTKSYYKIQEIVAEMSRRKESTERMQDAIVDIKNSINPDKSMAY
jgi:predicted Ser/Thr protein kinase